MTPHIPNIDSARSKLKPNSYLDAMSAEELSYQITQLIRKYSEVNGMSGRTVVEVLGSVELAVNEFERKVVNPWLEEQEKLNGGLY